MKTFSLGAVLSVTTGIFVAKDFDEVHGLIEYMAGIPVWTHQLPRVSKEITPAILAQYPKLRSVTAEVFPKREPEQDKGLYLKTL